MPTRQQWLEVRPYVRQWWLVEGRTGKEVAEKLFTFFGFYVKGSQVDYRARKWGFRKRLAVVTVTSENPTHQDNHSDSPEQRDTDDGAASHQTSLDPNTLGDLAQVWNAWATGESDASGSGDVHFTALSGPSSAAPQPWDYPIADNISYRPCFPQNDGQSLADVGSLWMGTQDGSGLPYTEDPTGQHDPAVSAQEDAQGSLGYDYEQAGFADFSHDIDLSTQLGIDPQDLPLWNPVSFWEGPASEDDTGAESGQEDVQ